MSGAWAIVPLVPLIAGIAISVIVFAVILSSLSTLPRSPGTTNSTAVVGTVLGAVSAAIFLSEFVYFIVLILVAVTVFKLVSRRNNHFNRQILLFEDLVTVAKEIAAKKNIDVSVLVNNMDRSVREARLEQSEKNATLWAIFYGLGWLYSSYFLMKDFFKHERREDLFINDLLRTFNALGMPINLPYRNPPIPDRSFALYFILTIITASIFGVYWVYVLVSDPNNHFKQQMMIEDTIMAQLSSTLPPSPAPAPSPLPG
ncbi:MAG TPA: DUF4234 domain-containing protein [Candidatus Bathyarchaeia archaeon]|nr:DUF4234 domain-containing protein [Candidatus Bathyarchaeia archaeon]